MSRAPRSSEVRRDPRTGEPYLAVFERGTRLKDDPLLNKGTAFTAAERPELGLAGLLPPGVSTIDGQAARAYANFLEIPDAAGRHVFLSALQDRNETLFFKLITDHLEEMLPVVYTPTVGTVCETYSHIYRRPRGLYVSSEDRGRMAEVLANTTTPDARIIVATDNEAILGIGDQGVGGMGIAVAKVALYTAAAGVHPAQGLALDIDVGTDNEALLADPMYLGVRHRRLRGEAYVSLMDELVDAIISVFPGALVQWEDFANATAFEVLERYRSRLPSFDDDIQGTAAVVEAGLRTALDRVGRPMADERIVFFGAGASGAGCAMQIRRALAAEGLSVAEINRRVLCLDSKGLILENRAGLRGHKAEIAADPAVAAGWTSSIGGAFSLSDVVTQFAPTILVGVSGQPGSFTEPIVRAMHARVARPIVFMLSNPTNRVEVRPEDLLRWTNGAALIGTGSPFAPVEHAGVTHYIGQCNNAFVFPGIGLAAMVTGARTLPDEAFAAAARALCLATGRDATPGAPLFPPTASLRVVSRQVALGVARALVDCGAAPYLDAAEIESRIAAAVWKPAYLPYRYQPT
jgi:malate dehydrogenase (oxaloacetate-decarboxylating)